jgi:hypothetical protein
MKCKTGSQEPAEGAVRIMDRSSQETERERKRKRREILFISFRSLMVRKVENI